jgi:hypothetical protein
VEDHRMSADERLPRVLISYSWDSPAHREKVLRLANRLRDGGIDCVIDQYMAGTPPSGWPLWMEHRITESDFVVMVCTEAYHRKVTGQEEPGVGLGAVWEGTIILNILYHQQAPPGKFVPVLFDGGRVEHIPSPLLGHSRYLVDTDDGFEALYRHLRGRPWPRPRLWVRCGTSPRRRRWMRCRRCRRSRGSTTASRAGRCRLPATSISRGARTSCGNCASD